MSLVLIVFLIIGCVEYYFSMAFTIKSPILIRFIYGFWDYIPPVVCQFIICGHIILQMVLNFFPTWIVFLFLAGAVVLDGFIIRLDGGMLHCKAAIAKIFFLKFTACRDRFIVVIRKTRVVQRLMRLDLQDYEKRGNCQYDYTQNDSNHF